MSQHVGSLVEFFGPPEFSRPDGLCVHCTAEPATEDWCPGGALAFVHGSVYRWCLRCVLTAQIDHCRVTAAAMPGLEARLAALPPAA